MKNLILVADAHIENNALDVLAFRRFLCEIGPSAQTLIILGDLFNLWIAKKRLEQSYHSEIINQLRVLKMSGVKLMYIEGNRDFHIKRCYQGDPFDGVYEDEHAEEFDGRRFFFQHGDMVNTDDRAYRFWRRFSRSRAVWKVFNWIPLGAAAAIARKVERILRGTNLKHKSYFPLERCQRFAQEAFGKGFDIAVIGHFHREEMLAFPIDGTKKYFYSLPAWKDERKYLLFEPGKEGKFVHFVERPQGS